MKSVCDCVLSCVSVSARSCDNSRRKKSFRLYTRTHWSGCNSRSLSRYKRTLINPLFVWRSKDLTLNLWTSP